MKKIYTSILIRTDMGRVMDVLAKKGKKITLNEWTLVQTEKTQES